MDLPASRSPVPMPPQLMWRTIPIPRDHTLGAWLAGPPFGVWCHHGGKVSKPCWHRLTGGKLACAQCGVSSKRLIGYVPLILKGNEDKRVVICSKTVLPEVEQMPPWTPVVCLCPRQRGLPAVIRRTDDPSMQGATWGKLKKRPSADIREYLLRVLWGVPELCAFYGLEVWDPE